MKTPELICPRTKVCDWRIFPLSALAIALLGAEPPAEEDQTHTLFMGLDLSIESQNSFHRVKDVVGDSFVITVNAAPVFLPVNRASHKLKVSHGLKLTSASATIANLTSVRAYTVGNNPRMRRTKEMNATVAGLEESRALAIDKASAASFSDSSTPNLFGDMTLRRPGPVVGGSSGDMDDPELNQHMAEFNAATILATSDVTSGSFFEARTQEDLEKELFDAIEVECELSSERPLNNAYILLVARFREPNAPPSTARNWIYAKSLDPIDSTPTKFTLLKGGFPRGYILENFEARLYNRAQEVATNVSPKRVPLTRDEAFEYVKIQYLAAHKGATLPATPAMGKLPADLQARLSGGQFSRDYYVKVSKDGVAQGGFMDYQCSEKIKDDYLENVVKSIRFKPALDKGKPTEDVARLKLEDLRL